MSKVVRSVKNVTKGYSSVQVKVRNATSNDPWGPTGTEMSEIAALTFNNPADFYEIMDMLDKRLNDKGKNWRHVLKSLKVLDYCLHEGSELVVTWARKNIYIIKTLREFIYVDDDNRDVGQNVRIAAKELTSLVLDEDRLRSERSDRKLWKTRVNGLEEYAPNTAPPPERTPRARQSSRRENEEDAEMRLAIEASKYEEEERQKRARDRTSENTEDDDLAKAIRLSKEEEDLRKKDKEDQSASLLFDDTPAPSQPQPTGYNQGYQQQPAVDWFGNPLQQQPQSTGYLNNAYAQPQQTGFQNGFAFQPQQTSFPAQGATYDQFGNPGLYPQQNMMQPQQTAFPATNPYQSSHDLFGGQSPQPAAQPAIQPGMQPGSHNPWAAQSSQSSDPLGPMQTGSNNPFAQKAQSPPPFQRQNQQPSLDTLYEGQSMPLFAQPSQANPIANYQSPQPQQQVQQVQQLQQQSQRPVNPQHAKLNALLASGEGQDTFGNTGDLRIPAQHTAPGVFLNSAGHGIDRLRAAQTGNNPFLQNQSTGALGPQGGYGAQIPAQTGPANGFGGSSNPFGARPGQQPQGASLIDF